MLFEQRVEKPAEFFLLNCGNPFDCVGSEITIQCAAEEHGKPAKNLGMMRKTGLRKAEEVVQVAGVAAVDHGFDLSRLPRRRGRESPKDNEWIDPRRTPGSTERGANQSISLRPFQLLSKQSVHKPLANASHI
jgi:hypothetical protein